jgi:hypothetical protein
MLLDTVGTNRNTEVSAVIDNGVDDRATCEKDRATGWIHKLTANNPELSEVRDALVGSRADMMDRVKGLNLPHIPYAHASIEDFLANPAALAEQIRGESYFYTIQPSNYAARVESPSPGVASLDHVVEIAQYFTKKATGTEFRLVLSEVRDIAYLGNIVVDEAGHIYGEFTDEGIPPTRSGVERVSVFQKDITLDTFHYNFEDRELRAAIYKSVSLLPHRGTGRERVWDKGYYELNLVRSPAGTLSPAFYDFRTSNAFLFVPGAALGVVE